MPFLRDVIPGSATSVTQASMWWAESRLQNSCESYFTERLMTEEKLPLGFSFFRAPPSPQLPWRSPVAGRGCGVSVTKAGQDQRSCSSSTQPGLCISKGSVSAGKVVLAPCYGAAEGRLAFWFFPSRRELTKASRRTAPTSVVSVPSVPGMT